MRSAFGAEDYTALVGNKRFVVAIDAYRQGYCTLAQVIGMSFDEPFYSQDSLSPRAFATLAVKIAQEVSNGSLVVDPEARRKYAEFYIQQEVDQE